MKQRNENFIILLVSLACIGLTVESIVMGWEFWVPPLLVIGTTALWVVNISGKPEFEFRKVYYIIYAMLATFFHGVHGTSLFDISIVVILVMIAFSFFHQAYMMHLMLAEYVALLLLQIFYVTGVATVLADPLTISRTILHITVVVLTYSCCLKLISNGRDLFATLREKERRIKQVDEDMEDFLSNISHELRTPVNVVNGMSDLMIKNNVGSEAYSVKDAGIRLAYQIEDIQDYTECKRKNMLLEEEEYMSTSLINDVVSSFRLLDNDNLELVVDLAPSVPTKMRGDIKKLHKIFRHLMENAVKFTHTGGIYIKMYAEETDYGVNLGIEVTDTGIGMDQQAVSSVSEGMYQVNKKRNRSSGGIGLGLFIVYGFTHRMGGFVKIESSAGSGTTVRVTVPQSVTDPTPCLALNTAFDGNILFHVRADKYKIPKVRDFYRFMAANLAVGIRVPLYSAGSVKEIEHMRESMKVTHIFMGQEEYEENTAYFDEMSKGDIVIAVSASAGFQATPGSNVIVMPKPLYAYPVIKILNEGRSATHIELADDYVKPMFPKVRALVVDDEPMNLVVATSLFADYKMTIDTAGSGREGLSKYSNNDYDVIFMDHMMPEMDGVEAMKMIKKIAADQGRVIKVVALTANVVSGAREMFMREGFDGFIAKPINLADFERVMMQVLPETLVDKGGENA